MGATLDLALQRVGLPPVTETPIDPPPDMVALAPGAPSFARTFASALAARDNALGTSTDVAPTRPPSGTPPARPVLTPRSAADAFVAHAAALAAAPPPSAPTAPPTPPALVAQQSDAEAFVAMAAASRSSLPPSSPTAYAAGTPTTIGGVGGGQLSFAAGTSPATSLHVPPPGAHRALHLHPSVPPPMGGSNSVGTTPPGGPPTGHGTGPGGGLPRSPTLAQTAHGASQPISPALTITRPPAAPPHRRKHRPALSIVANLTLPAPLPYVPSSPTSAGTPSPRVAAESFASAAARYGHGPSGARTSSTCNSPPISPAMAGPLLPTSPNSFPPGTSFPAPAHPLGLTTSTSVASVDGASRGSHPRNVPLPASPIDLPRPLAPPPPLTPLRLGSSRSAATSPLLRAFVAAPVAASGPTLVPARQGSQPRGDAGTTPPTPQRPGPLPPALSTGSHHSHQSYHSQQPLPALPAGLDAGSAVSALPPLPRCGSVGYSIDDGATLSRCPSALAAPSDPAHAASPGTGNTPPGADAGGALPGRWVNTESGHSEDAWARYTVPTVSVGAGRSSDDEAAVDGAPISPTQPRPTSSSTASPRAGGPASGLPPRSPARPPSASQPRHPALVATLRPAAAVVPPPALVAVATCPLSPPPSGDRRTPTPPRVSEAATAPPAPTPSSPPAARGSGVRPSSNPRPLPAALVVPPHSARRNSSAVAHMGALADVRVPRDAAVTAPSTPTDPRPHGVAGSSSHFAGSRRCSASGARYGAHGRYVVPDATALRDFEEATSRLAASGFAKYQEEGSQPASARQSGGLAEAESQARSSGGYTSSPMVVAITPSDAPVYAELGSRGGPEGVAPVPFGLDGAPPRRDSLSVPPRSLRRPSDAMSTASILPVPPSSPPPTSPLSPIPPSPHITPLNPKGSTRTRTFASAIAQLAVAAEKRAAAKAAAKAAAAASASSAALRAAAQPSTDAAASADGSAGRGGAVLPAVAGGLDTTTDAGSAQMAALNGARARDGGQSAPQAGCMTLAALDAAAAAAAAADAATMGSVPWFHHFIQGHPSWGLQRGVGESVNGAPPHGPALPHDLRGSVPRGWAAGATGGGAAAAAGVRERDRERRRHADDSSGPPTHPPTPAATTATTALPLPRDFMSSTGSPCSYALHSSPYSPATGTFTSPFTNPSGTGPQVSPYQRAGYAPCVASAALPNHAHSAAHSSPVSLRTQPTTHGSGHHSSPYSAGLALPSVSSQTHASGQHSSPFSAGIHSAPYSAAHSPMSPPLGVAAAAVAAAGLASLGAHPLTPHPTPPTPPGCAGTNSFSLSLHSSLLPSVDESTQMSLQTLLAAPLVASGVGSPMHASLGWGAQRAFASHAAHHAAHHRSGGGGAAGGARGGAINAHIAEALASHLGHPRQSCGDAHTDVSSMTASFSFAADVSALASAGGAVAPPGHVAYHQAQNGHSGGGYHHGYPVQPCPIHHTAAFVTGLPPAIINSSFLLRSSTPALAHVLPPPTGTGAAVPGTQSALSSGGSGRPHHSFSPHVHAAASAAQARSVPRVDPDADGGSSAGTPAGASLRPDVDSTDAVVSTVSPPPPHSSDIGAPDPRGSSTRSGARATPGPRTAFATGAPAPDGTGATGTGPTPPVPFTVTSASVASGDPSPAILSSTASVAAARILDGSLDLSYSYDSQLSFAIQSALAPRTASAGTAHASGSGSGSRPQTTSSGEAGGASGAAGAAPGTSSLLPIPAALTAAASAACASLSVTTSGSASSTAPSPSLQQMSSSPDKLRGAAAAAAGLPPHIQTRLLGLHQVATRQSSQPSAMFDRTARGMAPPTPPARGVLPLSLSAHSTAWTGTSASASFSRSMSPTAGGLLGRSGRSGLVVSAAGHADDLVIPSAALPGSPMRPPSPPLRAGQIFAACTPPLATAPHAPQPPLPAAAQPRAERRVVVRAVGNAVEDVVDLPMDHSSTTPADLMSAAGAEVGSGVDNGTFGATADTPSSREPVGSPHTVGTSSSLTVSAVSPTTSLPASNPTTSPLLDPASTAAANPVANATASSLPTSTARGRGKSLRAPHTAALTIICPPPLLHDDLAVTPPAAAAARSASRGAARSTRRPRRTSGAHRSATVGGPIGALHASRDLPDGAQRLLGSDPRAVPPIGTDLLAAIGAPLVATRGHRSGTNPPPPGPASVAHAAGGPAGGGGSPPGAPPPPAGAVANYHSLHPPPPPPGAVCTCAYIMYHPYVHYPTAAAAAANNGGRWPNAGFRLIPPPGLGHMTDPNSPALPTYPLLPLPNLPPRPSIAHSLSSPMSYGYTASPASPHGVTLAQIPLTHTTTASTVPSFATGGSVLSWPSARSGPSGWLDPATGRVDGPTHSCIPSPVEPLQSVDAGAVAPTAVAVDAPRSPPTCGGGLSP